MKIIKSSAVSLVSAVLCVLLCAGAFADVTVNEVGAYFRSDIGGCSQEDTDSFVSDVSGGVHLKEVTVYNAASETFEGELKPGRKYYFYFVFAADDGFVLPDKTDGVKLSAVTDDGCEVVWSGVTVGYGKDDPHYFEVHTVTVTDGNFIQHFVGKICDIILRLKTWSPY